MAFVEGKRMSRILRIAAFLLAAAAWPAGAASVLPVSLDHLVDNSAVVFEGTCVGNRTERDEGTGLVVTYTTFSVRDVIKGQAGSVHEIKQVGGQVPGSGMAFRVDGVPTFAVGESYVVFLAGVSTAGFSSPIGLSQGRFAVSHEAAGKTVSNGRDFREMTAGMPAVLLPASMAKAAATPVRQLGLDDFKQLVRSRVGRAQ
jgi:hypothetical protein